MAKIILVDSKRRGCRDGMRTKRYVVAKEIGVAFFTITRPFVLLMTTRTWRGVGTGER